MGRPAKNEAERFASHIRHMESGCHEWQSSIKYNGYGQFTLRNSKTVSAHRYAWGITNGDIPEGVCVLHHCDKRRCVNPDHLFLGSYADNTRDMVNKGRNWGRRKLTDEQVWKVRDLLDYGFSQQWIADLFDVHQTLVSRVKRGATQYASS